MSLSKLEGERPGNPHQSLNAYYDSMAIPYEGTSDVMREKLAALEPGEPAIVVRIRPDGSTNIGSFQEQETGTGVEPSRIAVWELPEDEFYFLKAFRHGLFEWDK